MVTVNTGDWDVSAGSDDIYDYYMPDVISYSDYYPFGMQMEGRYNTADDYKFRCKICKKANGKTTFTKLASS